MLCMDHALSHIEPGECSLGYLDTPKLCLLPSLVHAYVCHHTIGYAEMHSGMEHLYTCRLGHLDLYITGSHMCAHGLL